MPAATHLRTLEIDIPAQPDVLVKLSLLLADERVNQQAVAALIDGDMALASAVMRAVNSAIYGVAGRVQSVRQALGYLGTQEVAGITFEMGLRAVFAPAAELEPIWARASLRSLLMSRLAQALSLDAWAAHSAGLFEECGKAVLFRHAPDHYRAMLRAAPHDGDLCQLERVGFGVSHDALGAALCDSWGLGSTAVTSVRLHVQAQSLMLLAAPPTKRGVLALSVIAATLMSKPDALDEVAAMICPLAELDLALTLRSASAVMDQLATAQSPRR